MAWTAPRTWVTSELVTAPHLNEQIRDNMLEVTRIYARATATADVVSTAAETTFFTQSIGANDMETDRLLRLKFGGVTFATETLNTQTLPATRGEWKIEAIVANLGAANSQRTSLLWHHYRPDGTSYTQLAVADTLGTVDTTSAQTLALTAQWSASSANNSFRQRYAVLELV
jgi:thiamine kinase-like enzyme